MAYIFGLFAAAGIMLGLAWVLSQARTPSSAQSVRIVLGILAVILGVALIMRGLSVAGIPAIAAGLGLLTYSLRGVPTRRPMRAASTGMSRAQAADILGVSDRASEADIRAAYRERMKSAHPDAGGSDEEAARVQEARDVLLGS